MMRPVEIAPEDRTVVGAFRPEGGGAVREYLRNGSIKLWVRISDESGRTPAFILAIVGAISAFLAWLFGTNHGGSAPSGGSSLSGLP
jgi:hypothetical protein